MTHCWLETAPAGSLVVALQQWWERRGLLCPCQGQQGRTEMEQEAEDARKGPRSRAASCSGGRRRGGMLPLLLEFLQGLPRLLSAGSSRQSWPHSPCLQMKVRAAQVGRGERGGFCTFSPCVGPARGCSLAWQRLPAAPHPLQPWDPNPRVPPPPALAQPGCSSLTPQGYLGGHLLARAPPGACRNASGAFGGLS